MMLFPWNWIPTNHGPVTTSTRKKNELEREKTLKNGEKMEQNYAVNDYDDSRIHERKRYEAGVVFSHADRLYTGSIKNISIGGAYIETYCVNQFSPEDIVSINIPFPSGKNNFKRKGRVKWLNNAGFAVEFI